MRVKGIEASGLRYIAESCGLGIEVGEKRGRYTLCRLKLGPARTYRATSARKPEQYTGSVCYHGHYDFMRLCFEFEPEAVIVTGLARYEGKRDFETKAPEVGEGRPGMTLPTYEVGVHGPAIAQCCHCTEVEIERAHGIYRDVRTDAEETVTAEDVSTVGEATT